MQTNNILSASLIDIIFEGRNKDYGAYELRKTYASRVRKALLATAVALLLAIGAVIIANAKKDGPMIYRVGPEVSLIDIDQPPPEKLPEPVEPRRREPQERTEIFTPPVIKEVVNQPPPSIDKLEIAEISDEKLEGTDYDGTVNPEKIDEGKKIIEEKSNPESDEPRSIVQIPAKYNGDWKRFLERNLNGDVPVNNGAPSGRYSVMIQFVVNKEGNVSDIKPLTNHGYGMEEEAVRVLKRASKWEPGIQNGYPVKAYHKQIIVFQVEEEL
jgi:periplasmic protein TonB